jgi:hypothetical protein
MNISIRDADVQKRILKVYSWTGSLQCAADATSIRRSEITKLIAADPGFAEDLEDARNRFLDRLEQEAVRRAVEGWDEDRAAGDHVYAVRKFDGSLLQMLLKANAPEKYRERVHIEQKTVVSGSLSLEGLSPESREDLRKILERESQNGS